MTTASKHTIRYWIYWESANSRGTTIFKTTTVPRSLVIREFEAEFPGCSVLELESRGYSDGD